MAIPMIWYPKFSGAAHENEDLYIRHCRVLWRPYDLSEEEKSEYVSATMMIGLTGAAEVFGMTLTNEIQNDVSQLADALKARFPSPKGVCHDLNAQDAEPST